MGYGICGDAAVCGALVAAPSGAGVCPLPDPGGSTPLVASLVPWGCPGGGAGNPTSPHGTLPHWHAAPLGLDMLLATLLKKQHQFCFALLLIFYLTLLWFCFGSALLFCFWYALLLIVVVCFWYVLVCFSFISVDLQ